MSNERDERTDEYLNGRDWPEVAGHLFAPADVLFELDYTAYREIELDLHDDDCNEGRHVVTDMDTCDYCGEPVEGEPDADVIAASERRFGA